MVKYLPVIFFLIFNLQGWCQQPEAGFNRDVLSDYDKLLNKRSSEEHPTIQPYAWGLETNSAILQDTSNLVHQYKSAFYVRPVFNLNGGVQFSEPTDWLTDAGAGIQAGYDHNDRWSVMAGYTYWQRHGGNYFSSISDSLQVIPGVGYAVHDGEQLYHSHYTYGRLAYRAGKNFQFEAGKGKHFWGDGYRSLVLSENSPSYPYFRITTNVWHIKYTNIWARMRDISSAHNLNDSRTKYTALHALSWNVSKTLNVSLFEMVVWQSSDSLNKRHIDFNYLNPIIFFRPIEYGQGSADNEIIGFGIKVKASPDVQVYGQMLMDEFLLYEVRAGRGWWANKFGIQLGLKFFEVFTPALSLQTEFNTARPFTYTHGSPIQSWSHLNQPLAHPLGANFYEWVNIVKVRSGKFTFSEKFIWAAYGRDREADPELPGPENFGGNITRSYRGPYRQYGNETLQGLKSTLYVNEFEVSRKIDALRNTEIFLNYFIRFEKNEFVKQEDHLILIGIRSSDLLQALRDF